MKEKLRAFISLLTGNIVKDIGEAFDKNFTSKEEKEQALIEKEKAYNERLKILNSFVGTSDNPSWLRDNVRPLVFLIGFVAVTVMMLLDMDIDPGLQKIYTGWVGGMITLYFLRREQLKEKDRKKNS
mgnify:CR=1 FL=1